MGIRTAINPLGTLPEVSDNEDYLVKFVIDTRLNPNNASDATFILPIANNTQATGMPVVYWGDGTSTNYYYFNQNNCTHTYSTPGIYTIKCINQYQNSFPTFNFYQNYGETNSNKLKLKECKIVDGVTTLGVEVFYGCTNLSKAKLGNSITTLGYSTFLQCNNLIKVELGTQIPEIVGQMFSGCYKLGNIKIPNGITDISYSAFQNCETLKNIIIPDSVDYIGYMAFGGCKKLTSVSISSGIVETEMDVFIGCINLNSVFYKGNVPEVKQRTFQNCTSVMLYDFSHATSIPSLYSTASLGHAINCVIKVPSALLSDWQNTNVWKDLTGVVWQGV